MGREAFGWTRREFVAGVLSAAALTAAGRRGWAFADGPSAADLVAGKDPRLIVLGKKPIVCETPLGLLDQAGPTPAELLFVRNNQDLDGAATLKPRVDANWTVSLGESHKIRLDQLMELPTVSREMVLQCSGNSRAEYSKASPTDGTQWGPGGMGLVRFTGVPVAKVLEHLKIDLAPEVRYVTANGRDTPAPGKDDFEHSLPLAEVLSRGFLAFEMNGAPLPAVHGGPVRLITPGVFGTMQIKWLDRLQFVAEETANSNHTTRYRMPHATLVPGAKFELNRDNSRPNWGLPVRSVLLTPGRGATVPAGRTTLRGVAFNDGACPIESVLVSLDGDTWRPAKLEATKEPYAWTHFETTVELAAGNRQILTRAIDAFGRSQPRDGQRFWNPHGYEWQGVETVPLTVT